MITFIAEGVEMPLIEEGKIFKWLNAVAGSYNKVAGELGYCFCDDAKIIEVNRRFLDHDYYTDIITFDYTSGKKISGDIYISLETVRSNAESLGESHANELLRVIAHGVLHLCGFHDKTSDERAVMEVAENRAIELYKEMFG